MGRAAAVVLAAGSGQRMAAGRNKVLLPLGGRTILARSLDAFLSHPAVDEVLLVGDADELGPHVPAGMRIVPGGATRHDSERAGVEALARSIEAGEVGLVLVHDAARPLVTAGEIDRLLAVTRHSGAAILAAPVAEDELVAVGADGAWHRPPAGLWAAQTPQAFAAGMVLDAHRRAHAGGFEGTDTASVVERAGHPVHVVEGRRANLKITTPIDLALAEALLATPGLAPAHI